LEIRAHLSAAIYAHELGRATIHAPVRPHRAFPGRLPCAGEVTAAAHACRALRTLAPAELGQAVGRARCAAEAEPSQAGPCALRRHYATGPREDSAQWHLIIFLYFSNIFNSLQIQKFV
jgi:hypothetical protein